MALVKEPCLPMQETLETQVQSLGWEDPLEEGMETHSSILAWRISWAKETNWWATVHRVSESWAQLKRLGTHILRFLRSMPVGTR